jgi:CRISPR-associated protein Cas1
VSLQVDKGALFIRNGFTHYPQARETFRFFRGSLALPSRIIMLDGSGSLSFDVLGWLSEQKVPLIRIDWKGDAVSVVGGNGFPLIQDRVRWQVETRDDPTKRLAFCKDLIAHKLNNSAVTLNEVVPNSAAKELALVKAEEAARSLDNAKNVDDVRMIEARAAVSYFAAWKSVQLRWERLAKYPVPEEWKTVGPRGAQRANTVLGNRSATRPVNAILNYAYAVHRSEVQIDAVVNGFDPTCGVMHHSRPDATAFVYDLMEIGRAAVDAAVLKFIQTEAMRGSDFILRSDGVVRLAPQLARQVSAAASRALGPVAVSIMPAERMRADVLEAQICA